MSRRATKPGGVLVAMVVVSVAGCADKAPTKADFVADADAVCKPANAAATALRTPTDLPALKHFGVRLADNLERSAKAIEELDFPEGKEGKEAKGVVHAMREAAAAAPPIGAATERSDYTAVESAGRKLADAVAAVDAEARAFGFAECGKGEAEAVVRMSNALGQAVKTAYITAADALCRAAAKKTADLPVAENLDEYAAYLDQFVPVSEKLLTDLKAIPPPLTDKEKLDEFVALKGQLHDRTQEVRAAVVAKSRARALEAARGVDDVIRTLDGKARDYGFDNCGRT